MSERKKLWLTTNYNTTAQAVTDILHFTFIYSNSLAHVTCVTCATKCEQAKENRRSIQFEYIQHKYSFVYLPVRSSCLVVHRTNMESIQNKKKFTLENHESFCRLPPSLCFFHSFTKLFLSFAHRLL